MSKRRGSTHPPAVDRIILASGQFARLADALDRNDFEQAADARAELARLGYAVKVRFGSGLEGIDSALKPYDTPHKADGQEVTL